MGDGIARTLGLGPGDLFKPRPELSWTVVGILDSRGSPFDSEIWAKREEVGRYFGKDNEERKQSFYTSIVVTTKDARTAEAFAKDLQNRTQVRISAMPERKYYEEMSKSNQVFQSAAMFIAIIMAVGGMFGLMNDVCRGESAHQGHRRLASSAIAGGNSRFVPAESCSWPWSAAAPVCWSATPSMARATASFPVARDQAKQSFSR